MKNSSPTDTAFDFVNKVNASKTLAQLECIFSEFVRPIGVDFYMVGQLIVPGGEIKTVRYFCSEEHPWFRHYAKANLYLDDPTMRIMKTSHVSFTWSWLRKNHELSDTELNVFDEAAKFGLKEGLAFPFHGPFGSLAGVSLSGANFRFAESDRAALHIVCYAACQRASEISQLFSMGRDMPLSKRQRECLNWAQYGKSNREIAEILRLSEHTVKDYMDAAKNVLGVNTRIEAVIRARNANYIGFSPLSDRTSPLPKD